MPVWLFDALLELTGDNQPGHEREQAVLRSASRAGEANATTSQCNLTAAPVLLQTLLNLRCIGEPAFTADQARHAARRPVAAAVRRLAGTRLVRVRSALSTFVARNKRRRLSPPLPCFFVFYSSCSLRETVAKFLTHYCSSPTPLQADCVSKLKGFFLAAQSNCMKYAVAAQCDPLS